MDGALKLDLESTSVLARLDGPGVPQCADMTPLEARRWMNAFMADMALDPAPEVGAVEMLEATGPEPGSIVPVRLYRPKGSGAGALPIPGANALPIMVFFHAGGYVFGTLDGLDSFCRLMTREAGCLVASVDYRLAPEAKFPGAHEDAYAATCWIAEHAAAIGADPARIAVAGNSSGGTLAISVAALARMRGGPAICQQMLWYPGVGSAGDTESMKQLSEGYFLNARLMKWSMGHYLNDPSELENPLIQPLRRDDLSGLPPMFLMTAGFDPRRDDNKIYADRLAAAGVPTEFRRLDTIHGFMFMLAGIPAAVDAAVESAHYLRDVFARLETEAAE